MRRTCPATRAGGRAVAPVSRLWPRWRPGSKSRPGHGLGVAALAPLVPKLVSRRGPRRCCPGRCGLSLPVSRPRSRLCPVLICLLVSVLVAPPCVIPGGVLAVAPTVSRLVSASVSGRVTVILKAGKVASHGCAHDSWCLRVHRIIP